MKRHFPWALLLACGVILGGTLYLLLRDRFESGDVYPPSSSLRSDPLGTMVFYESLQSLPGVKVERDHRPTNQLPKGGRTVYLHLAARSWDWEWLRSDLHRAIDQFLLDGGRLVITLAPGYVRAVKEPVEEEEKKTGEKGKKAKPAREKKTKKDHGYIDLKERWGLTIARKHLEDDDKPAEKTTPLPLPKELKWHGDVFLEKLSPEWTVIYKNANGAVLAERKRGAGSIVFATDSYFVSNEAMARDRQPALLTWLLGPADHVVFDEAHFGITNSPGIAALARKYRLHGGVLALLVLAGLFIWKNSSSLAPPRMSARRVENETQGRSAGAGFIGLLKRGIPHGRILAICLEEWRKAFAHGSRFSPAEKASVEAIAHEEETRPEKERNPVATYRKICLALKRHHS